MTIRRAQDLFVQVQECWPAVKGCLAEVRKPCIRPQCRACAEGRKHPALIFVCRQKRRQRCLYVPRELAPVLRQAIENGRRLEALMVDMGIQMIREHRQKRV